MEGAQELPGALIRVLVSFIRPPDLITSQSSHLVTPNITLGFSSSTHELGGGGTPTLRSYREEIYVTGMCMKNSGRIDNRLVTVVIYHWQELGI